MRAGGGGSPEHLGGPQERKPSILAPRASSILAPVLHCFGRSSPPASDKDRLFGREQQVSERQLVQGYHRRRVAPSSAGSARQSMPQPLASATPIDAAWLTGEPMPVLIVRCDAPAAGSTMGKVPIRLREVVYTLSPFEQSVMTGLWKDLPHKAAHHAANVGCAAVSLRLPPPAAPARSPPPSFPPINPLAAPFARGPAAAARRLRLTAEAWPQRLPTQ